MDESDLSDQQLVSMVLEKDKEAFEMLIDRYAAPLNSAVYRFVGNREDVQDVVQEAFFLAYRDLDLLADRAKFGAWLRGIACNLARKVCKKRRQARRFQLNHNIQPNEDVDPAFLAQKQERRKQIHLALEKLSSGKVEIVRLYYFFDWPIQDISSFCSRPVGTVKRVLSEARDQLKEEMLHMAQDEFKEYMLTDEQRQRLQAIPGYPRTSPKIVVRALGESAPVVSAAAIGNSFLCSLNTGDQSSFACYWYPKGKLDEICHVQVDEEIELDGVQAVPIHWLSFSSEKTPTFRRKYYYHVTENSIRCIQLHSTDANKPLPQARQPKTGEPLPRKLVPGWEITNGVKQARLRVDSSLYQVIIGRRKFICLRYTETVPSDVFYEQFYLLDGRQLMHRGYRGSEPDNTSEKKTSGVTGSADEGARKYEQEFDDHRYRLHYDLISQDAFLSES